MILDFLLHVIYIDNYHTMCCPLKHIKLKFQYVYCCSCKYKLPIRKYLFCDLVLIGDKGLCYTEFLHNFILFQILAIDRMLHEQQLGLEWTSPDLFLLNREDLASYRSAMQVVSDLFPKIGEGKSGVFAVIRTIVVILLCFPPYSSCFLSISTINHETKCIIKRIIEKLSVFKLLVYKDEDGIYQQLYNVGLPLRHYYSLCTSRTWEDRIQQINSECL